MGILVIGLAIYLSVVAIDHPPEITGNHITTGERRLQDTNFYTLGKNWIRKNRYGVWEMFVSGDAYERGVINGKLSKELIYQQEKAFTDQIMQMVPSSFYRHFLRYFIAWFNRDLDEHISQEYKEEIFGVSQSASGEFEYIGSPYQRLMNYHAAHDIGHALQNMALVGCSSFSTWDDKSEDGKLILGRNFDFYVGDRFAENKIVYFCEPKEGNKFMMVTWGGLIGVVSGMNTAGLTITLNSAKSDMPSGSATPVSLLAREILQYASDIEEAVEIAGKRKTFVSESFMIGSARDKKTVVIEKTPHALDVYEEKGGSIVCTNHYQSPELFHEKQNLVQMSRSSSVYREERIRQLLKETDKNNVQRTALILRDKSGLDGAFIGYGNEKSINQLICHHSIIFMPEDQLVWVSTSPWQLGEYIAYDLNKIFSMDGLKDNRELIEEDLTIAPDSFLLTEDFNNFMKFRKMKQMLDEGMEVDAAELVRLNPAYYHASVMAGDIEFRKKNADLAIGYYMDALGKEIANKHEEDYIRSQIDKCRKMMH
jgi:hypothetical protein